MHIVSLPRHRVTHLLPLPGNVRLSLGQRSAPIDVAFPDRLRKRPDMTFKANRETVRSGFFALATQCHGSLRRKELVGREARRQHHRVDVAMLPPETQALMLLLQPKRLYLVAERNVRRQAVDRLI